MSRAPVYPHPGRLKTPRLDQAQMPVASATCCGVRDPDQSPGEPAAVSWAAWRLNETRGQHRSSPPSQPAPPMRGQHPPIAPRSPPRRAGGSVLILAWAFAGVGSRALANTTGSGGWLTFLTQQSLHNRAAALAALGLLGLLGGAVVTVALVAAGLLARWFGLDPPQRGAEPPTLGSERGPRRSRSARDRREEP